MLKNRSARKRMRKIVDDLKLPADWAFEDFVRVCAESRGRPILIRPLPASAPIDLCGLWLPAAGADLILHRHSDDADNVRNTITHEIGHMLCDHPGDSTLTAETLASCFTGITLPEGFEPSLVRAARGHTDYDTKIEYEAEMLSILVRNQARTAPLLPGEKPRDQFLKAFNNVAG